MLKGGLSLLWRGFEYARDLETGGWEFAVEDDALFQAGFSAIDLRWLIARGYVEFAQLAAPSEGKEQIPEKKRPFATKNACFILTSAGAAFAMQILAQTLQPVAPAENGKARQVGDVSSHAVVEPSLSRQKQKPSWDRDRKELRFGACVIKQFRWAAVNQETILMAFEEEDWPTRIDDPLPQKLNLDPKNRLHDTIKCLNRNHKKRLIRFSGDGTGEGIYWNFLDGVECAS
jgi:hypothetical protein